ncbi:unnamed protein product [Schistosoma rodhaini]|uniref:GPI alpha-1,4-mannosyltransferase I, catalytic subunit n=1 Tax=Schistosoma rodhaini TaxID=6188 RepID=A0AA85FGU1_9TREM|nr:unnamed protein product [Schistosoma rodhaini]
MNCSVRNVNEPYDDIIVIDSDVDNKSYIHSSDGSDEEEGFDSNIASNELRQDKLDYPVKTCNNSQGRIRQREVKEKKVEDSFSLKTCPAEMKQRKYNDSTKACDNSEEQSCHETVENKDTDTSKLDSDGNIHQFKYSISGYHTSSTNMYTNYNYYHVCLILALILRLVLVIFSVWQDTVRWPDGQLRFTDVDYDVFSDAAQAFVAGKNLYIERPTYRYSPLIAVLLAPGYWLFSDGQYSVSDKKEVNISSEFVDVSVEPHFRSSKHITVPSLARLWGKLIFITADLICGCIQYKIIQNKQFLNSLPNPNTVNQNKKIHRGSISFNSNQLALYLVSFSWLFNPVTSVVSARGNADGLQSCFVLACLWCILNRRIIPAGFLYGLCIHVCTAQYFLWSICLLPVALADIHLPSSITPYRAIVQNLMLWFGSQGIWLASAYALEMCTLKGSFLNHIIWIIVWTASLNFFACNIFILFRLISWRNRSLSDHYQEVSSSKIINYKAVVSPIIDSTVAVATNTNMTYQKYRISNKKTL